MRKSTPSSGNRPEQRNSFKKTSSNKGSADRKPFKRDDRERSDRPDDKPFRKKATGDRPRSDERTDKPGKWRENSDRPAFRKSDGDKKPFRETRDRDSRSGERTERSFGKKREWKDDKDFKRKDDTRPFRERERPAGDKPFRKERKEGDSSERPYRERPDSRPFREREKPSGEKPFRSRERNEGNASDRPYRERPDSKPFRDREKSADKPFRSRERGEGNSSERPHRERSDSRPFREREKPTGDKPFRKRSETGEPLDKKGQKLKNNVKTYLDKKAKDTGDKVKPGKERKRKYHEEEDMEDDETVQSAEEQMPLNKYIAHSGECSRRDAADMVKQGKVKVNGELVLDPGYKVKPEDMVTIGGKKLQPTKGLVYILLNKPKGFITTNDDPQGRKTVMELVANSGVDRLFPVGRLDRATTGLLLMTNDGDLTQKLSHPSYNIKKVYHVTLDKPLTKAHFEKIAAGVELEDGMAQVDALAYLEEKNELGLEIHSGRNRIVRRIFESLGYVVDKLDRVMYAGLTKKNLPRGKWRLLDPREIVLLKHFKS